MIDVLEIAGALEPATLERIRREVRAAAGAPATVLGAAPEERVTSSARRAAVIDVSDATRGAVLELLQRLRPRIEAHFGRPLEGCEEPQFLSYGAGDYFVAHQDGNTPLIHDESRFRKVSVVIFLSEPSEFEGGSLVLHGEERQSLAPEPGTLIAYPSETTHEVTPITAGERLSIVSWYRGAPDGG